MIPKDRTANHSRQFKTSFGSFPRLSLKIFWGLPPPPAMMTESLALLGKGEEGWKERRGREGGGLERGNRMDWKGVQDARGNRALTYGRHRTCGTSSTPAQISCFPEFPRSFCWQIPHCCPKVWWECESNSEGISNVHHFALTSPFLPPDISPWRATIAPCQVIAMVLIGREQCETAIPSWWWSVPGHCPDLGCCEKGGTEEMPPNCIQPSCGVPR